MRLITGLNDGETGRRKGLSSEGHKEDGSGRSAREEETETQTSREKDGEAEIKPCAEVDVRGKGQMPLEGEELMK